MAFCAVEPFADAALITCKNDGTGFPKRSHHAYSASFALVARAISWIAEPAKLGRRNFRGQDVKGFAHVPGTTEIKQKCGRSCEVQGKQHESDSGT
jgi:hypothetical protein